MIHADRVLTGKEVDQRYYRKNRQRIIDRNKKYAEKNKDTIAARKHEWYIRKKLNQHLSIDRKV